MVRQRVESSAKRTYNFTLTHGSGSWTLQEKKKSQNRRTGRLCRPVLQLPTGQFSQLANCWFDDPGAHGINRGQSKTKLNGGKNVDEGSGHDMAKGGQAHSLLNKALQANTAGGLSARHRSQNKQPAVGRPRSKTMAADDVGLPLAVQCR